MTESEILSKVENIAKSVLRRNDVQFTPETTAEDVDEWDSLTHMQLIMSVEKLFGTRFSATDLAGLVNVGDLLDIVAAKATR